MMDTSPEDKEKHICSLFVPQSSHIVVLQNHNEIQWNYVPQNQNMLM